ncbi:MAG: ArsR family transcriptional regulator [Candidatus Lokiarchaeota archaeon]|nr:ArsR family transcriptional regulator [Candidatus Lokiarchaeota archaeon]
MSKEKNENNKADEGLELLSQYWWLFGRAGGLTRINIVKLLLKRPYNANQIANELKMSYRNIKHHLEILEEASLVAENSDQKYGRIYVLDSNFNNKIFEDILSKRNIE